MNLKNTLCAIGILLMPVAVSAQDVLPVSIDLGIKAGVNFNTIHGDKWNSDYKTNLLGGAFVGIHAKRIGVIAEGLFTQTRYTTGSDFHTLYHEYYNDLSDSAKNGSFRLNQLNIPILLQVKLFPMVWLQLGPQFSTVVSVKDGDALFRDAADIFKKGDVGGVAGLDVKLPLGLRLNGRYVFGFTDVNNTTVADTWKQRSFQLSVGYSFL